MCVLRASNSAGSNRSVTKLIYSMHVCIHPQGRRTASGTDQVPAMTERRPVRAKVLLGAYRNWITCHTTQAKGGLCLGYP